MDTNDMILLATASVMDQRSERSQLTWPDEKRKRILQYMKSLDSDEREFCVLRFCARYSMGDISEKLDKSIDWLNITFMKILIDVSKIIRE